MNKIVASAIQTTIFMIIFCHAPMILRYLVEEAPVVFCEYVFFLQRSFLLHNVLRILEFIIVRYICVFQSKNLTVIQEDFWNFFLDIWIVGFSFIAYFVVCKITIKRPMDFYFCLGKVQKKSQANGHCVDYLWLFPFILIPIVLLVIGVKFKMSKYKKESSKKTVAKHGHYFTETKKSNLITFSFSIIGVIEGIITVCIPIHQMQYGDLHSLSTYPGYLWVYMLQLYAGNIFLIHSLPLLYGRNVYLSNFAKRVLKEKLKYIF